MYSYPRRDKYRTRLEKGVEPGTTEIFVSNRNVVEVMTSHAGLHQVAARPVGPRPRSRDAPSPDGEDRRRRHEGHDRFGGAARPPRRHAGRAAQDQRNAVLQNNGAGPLVVNDSFDRAWRRVGLALDRVGFTVEDRDRSKGLFYVRYIDPERDLDAGKPKESWTDKLKFWKSTPKEGQPQFRIHVADAGANTSQVAVQNSKGASRCLDHGQEDPRPPLRAAEVARCALPRSAAAAPETGWSSRAAARAC